MSWFMFTDSHSDGRQKTRYARIFVEAGSRSEAVEVVRERHGVDPDASACACCGPDFNVTFAPLLDLLAVDLRNAYRPPITMRDFLAQDDVDVVPAKQAATSTT